MNIVELLLDTADRLPDHPALCFKGETMTFAEIKDRVYKVAGGLRRLGVDEHKKVALMVGNRPEYIISYFAILANGATVVPINPQFMENEVTYILNDSEADFIIIEESTMGVVKKASGQFKTINDIICLGSEPVDSYIQWTTLTAGSPIDRIVQLPSSQTAQIIYTSGTTGNPKGAEITQSNLNWMSVTAAVYNQLTPKDRVLCVLPLFHAYAKLHGFLAPIAHGATIYLEEKFHPYQTLEAISKNRITVFLGVPTMYSMFLQSPNFKELDFSELRTAGSGGASLPSEVIGQVMDRTGVRLSEGYGLTESTVMLCTTHSNAEKKIGSVGYPLPGVDMKIVDPEEKEVAPGVVGEIIFRGPNRMKGYYKKPDETQNTIKDGWLYTGDLAYKDDDGYYFIVDRKKDIIIRGGFNIYPREIEEVLYKHPDIVECSVIGRPDKVFGEKTVAYIVTKSDSPKTEEFADYCKGQMADYKVPDFIEFIDALPKSGTGKILKTALKKQDKKMTDMQRQ